MEAESETKVIDRESKAETPSVLARDPLSVGGTVGRYELVHRLGHGGMAAVYLGRATGRAGFEKLVAVKVIHPHLAAELEFVEMFLDEARIAARLHHPHVVEIHDDGSEGEHKVRPAGTYVMSPGGEVHMEYGGPEGATVFFSLYAGQGHCFETLDKDMNVLEASTVAEMAAEPTLGER